MTSDKGFGLDSRSDVDRGYILSLRIPTDKLFHAALRALPAVATAKGRHSTIKIVRSRVFNEQELREALRPLVEQLAVRQTVAKPYGPHYNLQKRDEDLYFAWLQNPADMDLLADLEADPGIREVENHPTGDIYVLIKLHRGYPAEEVVANIHLYCGKFKARQG